MSTTDRFMGVIIRNGCGNLSSYYNTLMLDKQKFLLPLPETLGSDGLEGSFQVENTYTRRDNNGSVK